MGRQIVDIPESRIPSLCPPDGVPTAANDPFSRPVECRGLTNPLPACGQGGKISQIHPLRSQAKVHEMDMGVHESGGDQPTRQLQNFRVPPADFPNFFVVSGGRNPVPFYGNGFDPRPRRVCGVNPGGKNGQSQRQLLLPKILLQ
jgi:hypothetical protein